jgi:hypothetical protein
MSNLSLSLTNNVDAATTIASASAVAGDLGASNMANPIVGIRCRLSSGTAYIEFDFGSNVSIDVLALRFPRDTAFPTTGTITHTLDADGGTPGSGAALDTGAVSIGTYEGYGYHFYFPASTVTARYWRATFNVSNSFIDIGRAWAGEIFRPETNIRYGYQDEWGDLSTVTAAQRSGAEYVDEKDRQRSFSFDTQELSESEKNTLREGLRKAGIANQVLAVIKPGASDLGREGVIGRLVQTSPLIQPRFNRYSAPLRIRESL